MFSGRKWAGIPHFYHFERNFYVTVAKFWGGARVFRILEDRGDRKSAKIKKKSAVI